MANEKAPTIEDLAKDVAACAASFEHAKEASEEAERNARQYRHSLSCAKELLAAAKTKLDVALNAIEA